MNNVPSGYDELNAEDRLVKVMITLRELRPFYSAVYESLEKVESESQNTMGVSVSRMLYNPKFVESLSFKELVFVSLHEIAHVALMHVPRGKKRHGQLWNIVCDAYINKLLIEEFNLSFDGSYNSNNNFIAVPENGVFCSSIDTDVDYPELLYDNVVEQYENAKASGNNDNIKIKLKGSGSSSDKYSEIPITITNSYDGDLIDDGSSAIEQDNENRRILSDALIKSEMNKRAGLGSCKIERLVGELLKSYVDWRKLLRKYCINALSKDSSFKNPDKRMYYQRAIYPGQLQDESNAIKGVKVCFDFSGSISEKDMGYFHGQVRDILKQFKIEAEAIYWDTEIVSHGKFSDMPSFNLVRPSGGGGTDPSCCFEYFDSKKCKVKPVVTIVFTDGYIYNKGLDNSKWKKLYKDTIWVMTRDYDKEFKPPFGKITIAKFGE